MKHLFLILAFLATISCATSYNSAVSVNALGNGRYQANADGNKHTTPGEVRDFVVRAAYDTCSKLGKGYVLEETKEHVNQKFGFYNGIGGTSNMPSAQGVFTCDGEIDPVMKAKFSGNT